MRKKNLIGLTFISFCSYALTGALIVVTGIILENVSKYFGVSITNMSNTFTFLNAGILISIFLNSWLIDILKLKNQLVIGFILTIIAIWILIFNQHKLILFSFSIFLLGMVSGVTMSIGTFLITHLYTGSKRASLLLLTDSCFSMSGIIFPIISTLLMSHHITWYWIYPLIGILYLIIFILTLSLNFPVINHITKKNKYTKEWNISIFYLSISALLYILGQLSFISWIPEYITKSIDLHITQAGTLVSNFWMSYMIGMWSFSYILKYFNLKNILIYLTGISTLLMYMFNNIYSYNLLKLTIILLGFFSSAIYTIIITLASHQTKLPSPQIINFILTSGTIGTLLTFIVTGPIVKNYGFISALITSNILYGIVFILSILLKLHYKPKY
ncbi:MFS transporter TsgA [Buchnera aphidicola]|uniref:MFS transporter TsgA n=1 Tax=Buchnera aphidicola subsp. Melaphis rhois TaxID=118103 RepID=A0A4D6Y3F9_BUCMH|nr:MFS transporter TsgA [Buchnera aphidicola]QCI23489.1 MFS transporter TsgA [Buchnera aphidicola (Melaphis rhois)]